MSQGPLCPNLTQKVQKEVSQIANRNLPHPILLGGLSVNLNHLKTFKQNWIILVSEILNFLWFDMTPPTNPHNNPYTHP